MTVLQSVKNLVRSRSIHVCYVDTGSCNGCDIEVLACLAPRYDIEQYGIYVHNNPREADVLLIIGGMTPQWEDKLKMIWDRIPEPKAAVVIGNCPISGCCGCRSRSSASRLSPASHNRASTSARLAGAARRMASAISPR